MADKKISQLTVQVPTTGAVIPMTQAGTTVAASLKSIHELFSTQPNLNRNISGDFIVSGNENVTGNLSVNRSATLGSNINDFVFIFGGLRQSGNAIISGAAIVSGDLTSSGNLALGFHSGNAHRISGTVTVHGSGHFHGTVNIYRALSCSQTIVVLQNGIFGSSASNAHAFYGDTMFNHGVVVLGDTNLNGSLVNVLGNQNVLGNLIVTGSHTVNGAVTLGTNSANLVNVKGRLVTNNPIYFTNQVFADGDAEFSGDMLVKGDTVLGDTSVDRTTLVGPLYAQTHAYVFATLGVKNNANLSGNVNIDSGVSILGSTTIKQNVRVSGSSKFGNVSSSDTHAFVGDVAVSRDIYITGDVRVSGRITLAETKMVGFSGVGRNVNQILATGNRASVRLNSHGLSTGWYIYVTGANNNFYNGNFIVDTVIDGGAFTYLMAGSPPSPAAGTPALKTVYKNAQAKGVRAVQWMNTGIYRIYFTEPFTTRNYFIHAFCGTNNNANFYLPNLNAAGNQTDYVQIRTVDATTSLSQEADCPFTFIKVEPFEEDN
jgi:hypothetical protein